MTNGKEIAKKIIWVLITFFAYLGYITEFRDYIKVNYGIYVMGVLDGGVITFTLFAIVFYLSSLFEVKKEIRTKQKATSKAAHPIIVTIRRKPIWAYMSLQPAKIQSYGVLWHVFSPPFYSFDQRPWADGPYCPACYRELEEQTTKTGKLIWKCPMCNAEYPRPKEDVKEKVEKDFAALERKKRE